MECILFYTIGWETVVKFGNKYKTFKSVYDFYSFLKGRGIVYGNHSSFSIPAIIVNERYIKEIFE